MDVKNDQTCEMRLTHRNVDNVRVLPELL